jgi:hypothetical protein
MEPDVGDESLFEAEHADEPEVEAVLGFRPNHAVNVSACCNRDIDHVATALLTAAVMDVIGGVAKAELVNGQAAVVAGFPGVLGIADDDWTALGTAESCGPGRGTPLSGWSSSPDRSAAEVVLRPGTGATLPDLGRERVGRPSGCPLKAVA